MIQQCEHGGQSRKLCQSLTSLLGRDTPRNPGISGLAAQQLRDHFIDKVASVRSSTGNPEASTVLPPCWFLPESDYVTFGSLLSQIRLSVVCRLSVCNVGAPYSLIFRQFSSPLYT